MLIPYEQLSADALQGLIEDFVTRDGTDYGEHEVARQTKVDQVLAQLRRGEAVISYDADTGSCNIVPAKDAASLGGQ